MATLTKSYQLLKETYVGKAGSKNEKNVYVRIYAKYSSQSIENNTSTVQYKSTLRVTGSGSYFDTYGTTTKSISGTGITSQSAGCGGRYYVQEVTLYEVSTTIKHDDDGTKSITASGGWLSGPWGISGTATGSADLPQIPRAATLYTDPEVVEQGGSLHIRTESPVNIFYQKIWYTLNNNEHILVDMQQPTDTSEGVYVFEFDIPYSTLVADLSTFTSGEILIGCETWTSNDSEGTLLGFSHKRAEIQNGTIPMSWVDNRTGRVGVTIGEKALAGDYFFATILDTYLGKSGHRTKTYLEDTAFVGNFVELWTGSATTGTWDDWDMYSAYLFFVGTNTFIIPKALAGTAVNGVTISLEGTDTGRFNSSTAVKGVYGIK